MRSQANKQQTGEQRGGKYVARVQIGYEKDGSPRYKYFGSQEAFRQWQEKHTRPSKSKKREKDSKLRHKVSKEHKASRSKQDKNRPEKPDKKDPLAKSIPLFVRLG